MATEHSHIFLRDIFLRDSGESSDYTRPPRKIEQAQQELGWESVYAYNNEDFGPDSLLGRKSDREVVLTRTLRAKIEELNPGLPTTAYEDAVRQIVTVSASQNMAATNCEKYELIKEGTQVTFRNAKGERVRQRLRIFDFDEPANNHFLFTDDHDGCLFTATVHRKAANELALADITPEGSLKPDTTSGKRRE